MIMEDADIKGHTYMSSLYNFPNFSVSLNLSQNKKLKNKFPGEKRPTKQHDIAL